MQILLSLRKFFFDILNFMTCFSPEHYDPLLSRTILPTMTNPQKHVLVPHPTIFGNFEFHNGLRLSVPDILSAISSRASSAPSLSSDSALSRAFFFFFFTSCLGMVSFHQPRSANSMVPKTVILFYNELSFCDFQTTNNLVVRKTNQNGICNPI